MMPAAAPTATHVMMMPAATAHAAAAPAATHVMMPAATAHANVSATASGESLGLCSQSLSKAWRRNGQWCCNR